MADWKDYRERFKSDLAQASLDKERATQKQRLVDGKQNQLWGRLRDAAHLAVKQINGSDELIKLQEIEKANTKILRFVYVRNDEQRTAEMVFNPSAHQLSTKGSDFHKVSINLEFDVRADDQGQVHFTLVNGGGKREPDDIVGYMLDHLV